MDENGYPQYYRPANGCTYQVGSHMVNNCWIVPYNPYLSAEFQCHINVECAVSFKTVKYTVKYINKGGDRGTLALEGNDKIKQYIEGRYFATSEAIWRILHYDIHNQVPNVVRLPVHTEGQHMVIFDPDEDPEVLRRRIASEESGLTAADSVRPKLKIRISVVEFFAMFYDKISAQSLAWFSACRNDAEISAPH